MSRREVPFSPIPVKALPGHGHAPYDPDGGEYYLVEPRGARVHETRPTSALAALLEAAPHAEVDLSREELLPLRDVIQDALDDALTERERFIFDAIVIERLSLRGLGAITSLSKSQVDRIYKGALAKLRDALQDHPTVKEYLTR
jgi:RNA polymerase sigma factor (sigma-70 family)